MSTTFTGFVAERVNGTVPVLGGNPLVGFRQLMEAAANSAGNVGVHGYSMSWLANKVVPVRSDGGISTDSVDSSDEEVKSTTPRVRGGSVDSAAGITSDQLAKVLAESGYDEQRIADLISTMQYADHIAARKAEVMKMHKSQKLAKSEGKMPMLYDDPFLEWDKPHIVELTAALGLPHTEYVQRHVALAVTHSSVCDGRQTNRGWAQYGDSVLRTYLIGAAMIAHTTLSVGDVSNVVTTTQSGSYMYETGMKKGLAKYIRIAKDNSISKDVMSMVVEALYGVASHMRGHEGIRAVDGHLAIIFDGVKELVRLSVGNGQPDDDYPEDIIFAVIDPRGMRVS